MAISVSGVRNVKIVLEDTLETTTQDILDTLETEIKKRTPIDTGRARRGWMQRQQNTLRNNVPYIGRLEDGYSRQAPRGFTIQSIQATVRKYKA